MLLSIPDITTATCLCHKITAIEDGTATCPAPLGTLWTSATRWHFYTFMKCISVAYGLIYMGLTDYTLTLPLWYLSSWADKGITSNQAIMHKGKSLAALWDKLGDCRIRIHRKLFQSFTLTLTLKNRFKEVLQQVNEKFYVLCCFSFSLSHVTNPSGSRTERSSTKGAELSDEMLQYKPGRTESLPQSGNPKLFMSSFLSISVNKIQFQYWFQMYFSL